MSDFTPAKARALPKFTALWQARTAYPNQDFKTLYGANEYHAAKNAAPRTVEDELAIWEAALGKGQVATIYTQEAQGGTLTIEEQLMHLKASTGGILLRASAAVEAAPPAPATMPAPAASGSQWILTADFLACTNAQVIEMTAAGVRITADPAKANFRPAAVASPSPHTITKTNTNTMTTPAIVTPKALPAQGKTMAADDAPFPFLNFLPFSTEPALDGGTITVAIAQMCERVTGNTAFATGEGEDKVFFLNTEKPGVLMRTTTTSPDGESEVEVTFLPGASIGEIGVPDMAALFQNAEAKKANESAKAQAVLAMQEKRIDSTRLAQVYAAAGAADPVAKLAALNAEFERQRAQAQREAALR